MKTILAVVFLAVFSFAPAVHAETWRDVLLTHVIDGYYGAYSQAEVATVAAQAPVVNDTIDLQGAFAAVWAQAQDEEPSIILGQFILEADAYYQQVEQQDDGYSTETVRSRGSTGGW